KVFAISMLRHLAAIACGTETAQEAILAAARFEEELKGSTWSWFEIRQFLRWGVTQGILTPDKRDGIAQLLDFIEKQSEHSRLRWSFGANMNRLERLTLESGELRIRRTTHIARGHREQGT